MHDLPEKPLLEAEEGPLVFPCQFPLKLVGKNQPGFLEDMIRLVSRHVPGIDPGLVSSRLSSNDTYIAVHFTFWADTREQVDTLYLDISADDRILFAL
jgi:putative lipoic acid-binding regulatory protein